MMAATEHPRWYQGLTLKGRLALDAPLASVTWFRVGGPAEILVRAADIDDLAAVLRARPAGLPLTVLGVGSNLLIRDGGVEGLVLRLGRGFAGVTVDGDRVRAGAAALDLTVAQVAAGAGLAGLEFLSGIPGTVGGAFPTNAGAYGSDLSQVLVEATVIDGTGAVRTLGADAFAFGYRHGTVPDGAIVIEAVLQGRPDDPAAIAARMADIARARADSQPVRARTGGSTFKNPPGERAWALIDAAGCRGLVRGDAQVSELHCNFLINRGQASAADLEGLGEEVRRRVFAASGIMLDWEIRRLGRPPAGSSLHEVTP